MVCFIILVIVAILNPKRVLSKKQIANMNEEKFKKAILTIRYYCVF